jgi:thiamine-phosphate diphosphorylase
VPAFIKDRSILMAIVGPDGAFSAARAVQGGADLIQVRARELPARDLIALVRAVVSQGVPAERVLVNGRPDIAELTGTLGVHLPESGLDPGEVRRAFPGLVIGVSRHNRVGLDRAVGEGADYALLGPVFATPGKESHALGLPGFGEAVRGLPLPVLAVGGMTSENAASVVDSGARGVAAIRPFLVPEMAHAAAAGFRLALGMGGHPSDPS